MARGKFSLDFFLVLAPVFPSISTRARLAIAPILGWFAVESFLPPPCHTGDMRQVLEPFLPPPRHAGSTRQVFFGSLLPCYRVCVSFHCFSSRVPDSIARFCLVIGSAFPSTAFLRVFLTP